MPNDLHLRRPPPPTPRAFTAPSRAMAGSFWGNGEASAAPPPQEEQPTPTSNRQAATETIGRRAGALSDELDFPQFVGSLIHGAWDAMVDSSIPQMDSFADLVAAISKPLEKFREENVTNIQAYDWLVGQHPADLALTRDSSGSSVVPRAGTDEFGNGPSPDWLADYALAGQPLSPELIEEQLVPMARDRMARDRMQTLATLVMLGMNRIVVRDGSITARIRLRAAASDHAAVDYAVSDDPSNATPTGSWTTRGSTTYAAPVTKVSTVGVNAQTDSQLNAELFGEVKINFVSETIPLERFVDDARRTLLDRAARPPAAMTSQPAPVPPAPAIPPQPVPATSQPTPTAPPAVAISTAPAPQPGGTPA